LKSIDDIVSNRRCNNDLRPSGRLIATIQTSDWIFEVRVPILLLCNAAKESAMAKQHSMQEVRVPDLLAALTAYGLGGPRQLPRADEGPAVRRSWLARYLERTFARDDAGGAPRSSDLDDEWVGGSYARARRLLGAALHAARQRKGVS
jgi:hypothetical protein